MEERSLSDFEQQKSNNSFKEAVIWALPEVSGITIKQIVKAEKKTSLDDVHSFEDRIKKQLASIKEQKENPTYLTVSDIENIQKQAYDEAYKKGYEEAYKKGTEESQKDQKEELQDKVKRLNNCFSTLSKPLIDIDAVVEQQLTEMVYYLFKELLNHELSINPEHITGILQQAISRLPMNHRQLMIKLNPADLKLLQDNAVDIEDPTWNFEADESIAMGGCLVESETARIDLRLETRMRQLTSQLFTNLSQPDEATEADNTATDEPSDLGISDD